MERFVVGMSEDTEAEYGFRSDKAVSLLTMFEGECFVVEGFDSIEAARADLKANGVPGAQIEVL
jgi:hypothetical protein